MAGRTADFGLTGLEDLLPRMQGQYRNAALRYQDKLNELTSRSQAGIGRLARTVEIGVGAFGTAALSTWIGGPGGWAPMGVPFTLVCAAGLYGASLAGVAGKYDEDLANLGDGAVAAFMAGLGRAVAAGSKNQQQVAGVPNRKEYEELIGLGDTHRRAA